MAKRFEPLSTVLRSYGGACLDIVAQLPVTLSQGSDQVGAVVLVQKDAPNDLLIGTDIQPLLGFTLIMRKAGAVSTDLLTASEALKRQIW